MAKHLTERAGLDLGGLVPRLKLDSLDLAVFGSFNIYIFTPTWMAATAGQELGVSEASEIQAYGDLSRSGLALNFGNGSRWVVRPDSVRIEASGFDQNVGRAARTVLKRLPQTPVTEVVFTYGWRLSDTSSEHLRQFLGDFAGHRSGAMAVFGDSPETTMFVAEDGDGLLVSAYSHFLNAGPTAEVASQHCPDFEEHGKELEHEAAKFVAQVCGLNAAD